VIGLLNIQFAVKDEQVWVLEANPRASRTVPFVSKATGVPVAKVAARVLVGERLSALREAGDLPADGRRYRHLRHVAVKAAVLPFGRFPGVDTVLGPEMRSTGEVIGIAADLGTALGKAQAATGAPLPPKGTVFVSVSNRDKRAIVFPVKRLADLGFRVIATRGTAGLLARAGVPVSQVRKLSEGSPNAAELIMAGEVDLVINTPFGRGPRGDGYSIRTAAARTGIPCITTLQGAFAAVQGVEALIRNGDEPRCLQEYHSGS
jgi:carbamoyl-phosphate synthase large subunit